MTVGALIFAIGDRSFDYLGIASWNAQRIRHYLKIPVCVVTDQDPEPHIFDEVVRVESGNTSTTRWFADVNETRAWNNSHRVLARELSPWHRTLLLDADYVVSSTDLAPLLAAPVNWACHDQAMDAVTGEVLEDQKAFGRYRFPMSWATVMLFDRDSYSQEVFYMMQMIHDNWKHYRDIYQITNAMYRNDYALSIALNVIQGHGMHRNHIPWPLLTASPQTQIAPVQSGWRLEQDMPDGRRRWHVLRDQDLHVMSKQQLERLAHES